MLLFLFPVSLNPGIEFSTLGAETFASRNFREFREFCPNSRKFKTRKILYWPIRESLCTRNFSIFFFFSPNLLASLGNALILVSWRNKSRRQCNTKTRSASIAICVRKMFCARKRGLIRQKLEIIWFFSLFYFYLDPNVSLKQQKKINFSVHSRKFKTAKILFWPIRESLCSRNAKISRIFPLEKVSARESFCS